jgi:hypothetical protein
MELTSSELTALIYERKWKYYPFKKWTVKINEDDTVETSGQIISNKLIDALKSFGIDLEKLSLFNYDKFLVSGVFGSLQNPQIERFYSLLNQIARFVKSNPSFYIKGKAKIEKNKITLLQIDSVYLGKLNLTSTVNKYLNEIKIFIEEILDNTPGLYVTSLVF